MNRWTLASLGLKDPHFQASKQEAAEKFTDTRLESSANIELCRRQDHIVLCEGTVLGKEAQSKEGRQA